MSTLTIDELKTVAKRAGIPISTPGKKGMRKRAEIEADLARVTQERNPIALEDEPKRGGDVTNYRSELDEASDQKNWLHQRVGRFAVDQQNRDLCFIMDDAGNIVAAVHRTGMWRGQAPITLPMKRNVMAILKALNEVQDAS